MLPFFLNVDAARSWSLSGVIRLTKFKCLFEIEILPLILPTLRNPFRKAFFVIRRRVAGQRPDNQGFHDIVMVIIHIGMATFQTLKWSFTLLPRKHKLKTKE